MAKVMDGARTSLSGKADGLVYVQFNGGVYTRKLPKRKKEAWTKGMLQNLERFKRINAFCSLFKDSLIPQIWNQRDEHMSGYALFLKTNKAAFAADGRIQDVKMIKLSTGGLSFPAYFQAKRKEGDENLIEVNWPRQMQEGGVHLRDELMAVCCFEGEYSGMINTGIARKDLKGTFALPATPMAPAPGSMLLYLFFAAANRRDYSQSVCFEV